MISIIHKNKNRRQAIITELKNYTSILKQEDIPRIFDRFYVGDITRSKQNSGVGLAIVKTLSQQLGNKVEAELINGKFTIRVIWKI